MVISLICLINLAAMWFYTCRYMYYKAMFFDRSSTTHVAFFTIISNAIIFLYRNYLVILVGVNFCGLILVKLLVVLILWFTFKYL